MTFREHVQMGLTAATCFLGYFGGLSLLTGSWLPLILLAAALITTIGMWLFGAGVYKFFGWLLQVDRHSLASLATEATGSPRSR